MSIVKNLGKSLLIAGIFMLLAAPVMAKGPHGAQDRNKDQLQDCSCCYDEFGNIIPEAVSYNPDCPCYIGD